jgi:RNA polymerase sigma-70 factor (ECF subfamily)
MIVRALAGTVDSTAPAVPSPALEFSEIFRTYAPFAWRLLRRLGVAEADANDVSQEVFVVVHRKLAQIVSSASVRSFVYAVCVRAASDYRRSARVRLERVYAEVPEQSDAARQHAEVETRQARQMLHAVLSRLSDEKRETFILYELEELPMVEVAEVLDCPLPTAYSRLHAARAEVQAAFARKYAGKEGR